MPGFFIIYQYVARDFRFRVLSKEKEMKTLTILTIGLLSASLLAAQETNEVETRHLVYRNIDFFKGLEVDLKSYSFRDPHINQHLSDIVKYQHKSYSNTRLGVLLATIGTAIVAITVISEDPEPVSPPSGEWLDIELDFGPAPAIVSGSLIAGASVPFFLSSGKNKRKMKAAIRETKLLLMQ